jgi:hypothetical protein
LPAVCSYRPAALAILGTGNLSQDKRPTHLDEATPEINVAPLQGQEFPQAHPGSQGAQEEGVVPKIMPVNMKAQIFIKI